MGWGVCVCFESLGVEDIQKYFKSFVDGTYLGVPSTVAGKKERRQRLKKHCEKKLRGQGRYMFHVIKTMSQR